jgi:small subunit ribosomal protein S18
MAPRPREKRKPKKALAPRKGRKRYCQFCADKTTYIDYKDIAMLRKFVSERGKIRARRVTGNCAQHQRLVATAVKNAREMALLTYSAR